MVRGPKTANKKILVGRDRKKNNNNFNKKLCRLMMAIFFPPRCAISSSKENSKSHPSFLFSTGLQDRESQKKTCSCPASFALFHQKHFINFVLTCFNWKRKKSVSTLLLYHLLSKVIYTSLRFIKIPVRVFTRKKFMLAWGKEKKREEMQRSALIQTESRTCQVQSAPCDHSVQHTARPRNADMRGKSQHFMSKSSKAENKGQC